jgi:hypothetical protein
LFRQAICRSNADIRAMITKIADDLPSDKDISGVRPRLALGGCRWLTRGLSDAQSLS